MDESIITKAIERYWSHDEEYTFEVLNDQKTCSIKVSMNQEDFLLRLFSRGQADKISDNENKSHQNRTKNLVQVINYYNKHIDSVQQIVKSRENELFCRLDSYDVVCFKWIEGTSISSDLNSIVANQLGQMIASFHLVSRKYYWNETLLLPKVLDSTWLLGIENIINECHFNRYIDEDDYQQCLELLNNAKELIDSGEKTCIHGDLHLNNIIRGKTSRLSLIDFEEVVVGSPLFDIGTIFLEFEKFTLKSSLKKAFLEGYNEIFFIETNNIHGKVIREKDVSPYMILSGLMYVEWIFTSSERVFIKKKRYIGPTIKYLIRLATSIKKV